MAGYVGICSERGHYVPEEHALEYALDELKKDEDLQAEFVDWFYSGNCVIGTEEENV